MARRLRLAWPLAVALALRLACLPWAEHAPELGDVKGYLTLARHFATGAGFRELPSGVRPPLHRVLVAPGLDTDADPPSPYPGVYLIQVAGDVLACGLMMLLARRRFGTRAAACTGWIYALFPPAVLFSATTVLAEPLSVLMAAGALLGLDALDRALDGPPGPAWRRAALLGVVLGLGLLAKELMLVVCGVFVLVLLLRRRTPLRRRAGLAGLILLLAGAVTTPWALFNQQRYGLPVFSGTHGQYSIMIDNAPAGQDALRLWHRQRDLADRVAMARTVFRRALSEYPGLTARRALNRLRVLLGPEITLPVLTAIPADGHRPPVSGDFQTVWRSGWRLPAGTRGRWVQVACGLATVVLFGLAAAGLLAAGRGTLTRTSVLMLGVSLAGVLLTVASARYRFVLVPFLVPFAGMALPVFPAGLPRRAAIGGLLTAGLLAVTVFLLPAP